MTPSGKYSIIYLLALKSFSCPFHTLSLYKGARHFPPGLLETLKDCHIRPDMFSLHNSPAKQNGFRETPLLAADGFISELRHACNSCLGKSV